MNVITLQIILHYHCTPEPWPNESPASRAAHTLLVRNGLLLEVAGNYEAGDKLADYVEKLKSIPVEDDVTKPSPRKPAPKKPAKIKPLSYAQEKAKYEEMHRVQDPDRKGESFVELAQFLHNSNMERVGNGPPSVEDFLNWLDNHEAYIMTLGLELSYRPRNPRTTIGEQA